MSTHVQIIGRAFDFVFGKEAIYRLQFIEEHHLAVTVVADPTYARER